MKNLGINFYLFLPTHLSTILLRKHGLISKSTSKRYYQVALPFMKLSCPTLVLVDYRILHLSLLSGKSKRDWSDYSTTRIELCSFAIKNSWLYPMCLQYNGYIIHLMYHKYRFLVYFIIGWFLLYKLENSCFFDIICFVLYMV